MGFAGLLAYRKQLGGHDFHPAAWEIKLEEQLPGMRKEPEDQIPFPADGRF